ncbi:hypothetical protein L6452_00542 [Arctium lappa]|uniref:Uncharacterized protein n=1 Tax=Arctium lappa TaxID=4217 RepID=A0ACB9FE65_ARCLA|nr:hypothetical protein L6452_00542 [Arctium lappa]
MGNETLVIVLVVVVSVCSLCMLFRCFTANEDDEQVHDNQVEKVNSREKGNPREIAIDCGGGGGGDGHGGDGDGGGGCGGGGCVVSFYKTITRFPLDISITSPPARLHLPDLRVDISWIYASIDFCSYKYKRCYTSLIDFCSYKRWCWLHG